MTTSNFRRLASRLLDPKHSLAVSLSMLALATAALDADGYTRGVDYTDPMHSVSKMFWIPPLPENFKPKLIEEKAGYLGKNTATLLCVDMNGIPFHLIVNSDKPGNVAVLQFLAKKCQGAVICVEGSIRQPFLTDGPMGFRFYNVSGSFQGESQIFHADDRYRMALDELHRRKRQAA